MELNDWKIGSGDYHRDAEYDHGYENLLASRKRLKYTLVFATMIVFIASCAAAVSLM